MTQTSTQGLRDSSLDSKIEQQLLANLMWHSYNNFHEICDGLIPECFTNNRYRKIFAAMMRRIERGESINDPILLEEEIVNHEGKVVNGITATEIAIEFVDSNPMLDSRAYAMILMDRYNRRRMQKALGDAILASQNISIPLDETMSKAVDSIVKATTTSTSSATLAETIREMYKVIDRNASGLSPKGLTTGFRRLDSCGGLHPGDLVIVAAETSQGKTAMALTMVMNAVRQSQAHAIVYSMEMSALQLTARILSPGVRMPSSVIMYQPLTATTISVIDKAVAELDEFSDKVFFDETASSSLANILSSIRRHVARYGVNLVMVDYLQIINLRCGDITNREDALADAARQFKDIARELGIVVVLLSQFSRDGMVHSPSADRIRGSGQINEASDLTLIVYRPEVWGLSYTGVFADVSTKGTAMIKIDKDRFGAYGGTGQSIVGFSAQTTTFYDLEQVPRKSQMN